MGNQQLTKIDNMSSEIKRIRHHLDNSTSKPSKRESILVYRNENDDHSIMRIRCGIAAYLKKYKDDAIWYKEYTHISNSKKAINYLRDAGMITFEKGKTTKAIMDDKSERLYLRNCLKKLDDSYA